MFGAGVDRHPGVEHFRGTVVRIVVGHAARATGGVVELLAEIGESGDLQAAYRTWLDRQMEEKDRRQIQFAKNLSDREAGRGK